MSINTNYNNHSFGGFRNLRTSAGASAFFGLDNSQLNPLGTNMMNSMMRTTQNFLSTAGTRATQLSNTIANLPALFNEKTTVSSNMDLMRIKSFTGKTVPDTTVLIDQVATTQKNEGTDMRAGGTVLAGGLYRFEIEVDGKKHQISFSTDSRETNQSFQQKMAEAINRANIGVTASVTMDDDKINSRLNLETKTTGEGKDGQPRFTINDLSGNAVTLTGVDKITQQAQNAIYSINGGEKQNSASNDIKLSGELTITLVEASEDEVTISLGKDRIAMQNGARQLINFYNALLEAAKDNASDKVTRKLVLDLEGAVNANRSALRGIGIQFCDDGYLVIDEKKMKAAAEDGTMERFFGSNGSNNFISRLSRLSNDVSKNPMGFVSANTSRFMGFNPALSDSIRTGPSMFDSFR